MTEFIFVMSFPILLASATVGQKLSDGLAYNRPLNPLPLNIATGLAGICAFLFFGVGFFVFTWWLPLLALLAAMVVGPLLAVPSIRSSHAPLFGIGMALLGVLLGALSLVVAAART